MRFHLLMLLIVVLVSLGMHGLATAQPSRATGAAPMPAGRSAPAGIEAGPRQANGGSGPAALPGVRD